MANAFQVGDVVQLKSGGPKMTVEAADNDAISDEPLVFCVWFEKEKKHTSFFKPATLDKVDAQGQNAQPARLVRG